MATRACIQLVARASSPANAEKHEQTNGRLAVVCRKIGQLQGPICGALCGARTCPPLSQLNIKRPFLGGPKTAFLFGKPSGACFWWIQTSQHVTKRQESSTCCEAPRAIVGQASSPNADKAENINGSLAPFCRNKGQVQGPISGAVSGA